MSTNDSGIEYILKHLRSQQERIKTALVGTIIDREEYLRLNAMHHAFEYAIELINDTANKVANDEELIDG